jgi:hypothetical protein
MTRRTARRGAVALLAAVGVFIASSVPAQADPPTHNFGDITIGGDEVLEIGGEDENPCASTNVDATFSGNATSGTWSVTGSSKVPFTISSDPAATKYQAEISFLAGSGGSYSASGATMSGTLNVQAVMQTLDKDNDCAKVNVCTVRTRLIVDSTQSSHSGSLPSPPTGTTELVASTELTGGIRPVVTSGSCPVTIQGNIVGQSWIWCWWLCWLFGWC